MPGFQFEKKTKLIKFKALIFSPEALNMLLISKISDLTNWQCVGQIPSLLNRTFLKWLMTFITRMEWIRILCMQILFSLNCKQSCIKHLSTISTRLRFPWLWTISSPTNDRRKKNMNTVQDVFNAFTFCFEGIIIGCM